MTLYQALRQVLLGALGVVLMCTVFCASVIAFAWWVCSGGGGGVDISTAWSEFLWLLAILLACCFLAGLQPVCAYPWEARPSIRAARAEEANRKAQAALRRALLLAEASKARAHRQTQIIQAITAGFEAWNRQWEETHPEEARALETWHQEAEMWVGIHAESRYHA